ncbi:MAG: hypothetical protein CSA62_13000 [Planctomycetota bacterium]|nr:MAG: hypothetical protein CSA62_13000 [Planctomycetota bacterium]
MPRMPQHESQTRPRSSSASSCSDRATSRRKAWRTLHCQLSLERVREEIERQLSGLLPGLEWLVGTYTSEEGELRVEARSSGFAQHLHGARLPRRELAEQLGARVILKFQQRAIGELLLADQEDLSGDVGEFLEEVSIALVQSDRSEKLQDSLEAQGIALEAMKNSIELFGEPDLDRMCVGYLNLVLDASRADAAAIYLRGRYGLNVTTQLELHHILGIPPSLLESLRFEDGATMPEMLVRERSLLVERDEEGRLLPLLSDGVPEQLKRIYCLSLEYEGEQLGSIVILNPPVLSANSGEYSAIQHLGLLGGALFRRKRLELEEIERRKMESEMSLAGKLQQGLQPSAAPQIEGLEFAWRSDAARQVGGDYIDLFEEEDGAISAVLADVSGHGVSSALLMTTFRSGYRVLSEEGLPSDKLNLMNWNVFSDVGDTGMFITAAAVTIGRDGRSLAFCSAGHNPVWIYRAARDEFQCLDASGPPLGLFDGLEYEGGVEVLEDGDLLVLFSDGIVEAQSEGPTEEEEQLFGDDRFQQLVREHASDSPQELVDAVYSAVEDFTQRKIQEDDTSILVIKAV